VRRTGLRVEVAARSDRGCVRSANEDCLLVQTDRGRFAVVDGMGGEAAGEVAAALARDTLAEDLSLSDAVVEANRRVRAAARSDRARTGMGCVLTAVELGPDGVDIAHVGDTRAYVARAAGVSLLTRDHTVAAEQADILGLDDAEAASLPSAGRVTRDVGGMRPEEGEDWVDRIHHPLDAGDLLLLCSDGLTDVVPSDEIFARMRRARDTGRSAVALCDDLLGLALARGGPDNVSLIVLRRLPRPRRVVLPAATMMVLLAVLVALLGLPRPDAAARAVDRLPLEGHLPGGTVDLVQPLVLRDGELSTVLGFETEADVALLAPPADPLLGTWRLRVEEGATLRLQTCELDEPGLHLDIALEGVGARLVVGADCALAAGSVDIHGPGTLAEERCLQALVGAVRRGPDTRVEGGCG